MRRDRIISAVNNLRDALQACQIRDLLRAARSGQPADGVNRTQNILLAYNVFTRHYQNFSEDEKELMGFFGLSPLLDITFWSGLIDSDQSVSRKLLADVDVGAYNVIFVMPKLRELLTRENDRDELFLTDAGGREREMKRVRLMVAEKERSLTAPSIIMNIVRGMDELYESLASLYGESNVQLAVGGIDSGSAKSFDFFGATAVMGDIRTLLINVWDRIKYSSEENFRYQIEVAIMATGFIGRVKEAQMSSLITEDQGQRITRTVAKSIEMLFRSGAYTEEMDAPREVKASQFLAPKQALIEFKSDEARAGVAKRDDLREALEMSADKLEGFREPKEPAKVKRDTSALAGGAADHPMAPAE